MPVPKQEDQLGSHTSAIATQKACSAQPASAEKQLPRKRHNGE
jgi:hypothetical protein